MNETNYIKLEFPSKSCNEAFARTAAAAFAAQLDPTLEELGDIKTAVSEAVTNAIVHGYPDTLGRIAMRLRIIKGNTLEISIRDWGRGIADVQQAMTPLYTTGGEERSGMGFTIMGSFMDKLRVRSSPGKGTTVVMQRFISPRQGKR
ncbi:MAG: anti-sigma F factor [bacterium]|nr:anti-sigma F factor [Oscillospiraceae bacterium]MDO5413240.1 anti-sigma F factor [bacterium]MDY4635365.1 anti-sigma F factor [Candidatus Limivicinus sp.]MDY5565339.1 anti-sigma F factor [Candidatus Limivicinus sp.]